MRRRLLAEFLEDEELVVVDVVAGAAPGTRRLHVGDRAGSRIQYAVSVPLSAGSDQAVHSESRMLALLASCSEGIAATVPVEVEQLAGLASASALVVTPAPGIGSAPSGDGRRSLEGAVLWLTAFWRETSGAPISVELGHAPVEKLLSRSRNGSGLGPSTGPLLRARQRLAEIEVPSTAAHGCLCVRHVHHDGAVVVGVDDWSAGSVRADPLRDLGRYAVDVIAGHLPEVLSTRSQRAVAARRAVSVGLEALSAPPRLWRDVLLLAQLEATTETLDSGDQCGINLLRATIQALPAGS